MQGGCICENTAYLRVGTTNIELSALIAPRPLGMTGADDWTFEIEKKGLPELKQIYKMYGVEDKVMAKYLKFPHNYNQPSREVMYNFFNQHLGFGQTGTITEKLFTPVDPKQLSVYDDKHPLPPDALNAEGLKRNLTVAQEKQLASLLPKDAASLAKFQKIEHAALRAMMTAMARTNSRPNMWAIRRPIWVWGSARSMTRSMPTPAARTRIQAATPMA